MNKEIKKQRSSRMPGRRNSECNKCGDTKGHTYTRTNDRCPGTCRYYGLKLTTQGINALNHAA